MVRSSSWIKLLLVLVMVMVSVVTMAPVSPQRQIEDMSDWKRNARSANPSSIAAGTVPNIRIIINGRILEILPNGVVVGTENDDSDNSILYRTSVNAGQVKLEGVATCSFLCMTSCGCLYASPDEVNDECIFNETLELNHYVTYSSIKYSNQNYTFYVALNRQGLPHRVKRKTSAGVGNKSDFVDTMHLEVNAQRMEQLEQRKKDLYTNHQHHHLRHRQLCPPPHHAHAKDNSWRCKCRKKKKSCAVGADRSDEAHPSAPTKEAGQRGRHHGASKKKAADCKGKKSHKKSGASKSSEVRNKAHASEEADEKEATTPVGADDGDD